MTSAATGKARSFGLHGVLQAVAYILELFAIAGAYFGLAVSGLLIPWINPTATPLWPPTGVALALMLIRGYRIWPAIFVGGFFATAVGGGALSEAACIALGTPIAALAGTWLINRWSQGRETFATPLDVAKFALIAFAPTAMISATMATVGLVLANDLGLANPVAKWAARWLADAGGTLIIAPVIVLWAIKPSRSWSRWSLVETAGVVIVTAAIAIAAFGPQVGSALMDSDFYALLPYRSLLAFLVVLPLLWASLRGNPRDAAAAAPVFCAIAAWGFATSFDLNGSPVLLLALVLATSLPPLILAAAVATHQQATARLQAAHDQLSRQVAETALAFERSKRHFQILIEGVVDHAVFLLDRSGRVASWNSTAQQIIGYTADEIIGKHFGVFYRPDERRSGEPNRVLELAVKNGKHAVEGWRIKKNGTLFFVTGTIRAIHDDDGNLIGLANVLRDATERRNAQEKLVEAREQLAMSQKMEAIGKLTGGIAHDFNNLLMIIGGNAQIFERLLDPKLPRAIEAIQTAAKRGESLTRQLLTFSRRQHLSPTIVDLSASIKNIRPMIESSLRGNIVYNEADRSGGVAGQGRPCRIGACDRQYRRQCPRRHAERRHVHLDHRQRAGGRHLGGDGENGDFIAVQFSDTGVGIPPNLLSKIFDPFFTTKEVGKGTGLGLSQVYGFVHQAGGTINAESKVGQGTTITVYLPSCFEKDIAKEIPAMDAPRSQRPMVLIVDDSAEVAEVTSSLFERLGYDTDYRDSADAALKYLAEGTKIDLVFSDIVMPGTIDGVGLAREIRSRYPDLPVLLTTGYSDAAQAAPADLKILRKPFDTVALRGFIADMMAVDLAS